jgi:hypothetical protein
MSAVTQDSTAFSRDDILRALRLLSDDLSQRRLTGEICLFGGTVMVLAFSARVSTKDVDALFHPAAEIRTAARRVAEAEGFPDDWLNDGVKGFLSENHNVTAGNLPQFPNLYLTMPVPEYLLAMKCMAGRLGMTSGEGNDVPDIRFLLRHLKIKSAKEALDLVASYYPADRISMKTQYLIESLFAEGHV